MTKLWLWYAAGILLTLAWKWQRYCYAMKTRPGDGEAQPSNNPPVGFWDSSLEWWKSETLGSQVSWGATLGGAWVIGFAMINRSGMESFLGGAFMSVPNVPPMIFFIGSVQEMIVPALMKWIVRKFGGDTQ